MSKINSLGIIGLGKMGSGMAALAIEKGYEVFGNTQAPYPEELDDMGINMVTELSDYKDRLSRPRVILLSLPAGNTIDQVSDELCEHLAPGDIICDTGNSYWGDSVRRHKKYAEQDIHFLDLGTSGGPKGARNGPAFMIGGPTSAVKVVKPILTHLAVDGGFVHAGGPGCGHYVKLVHNGIEFAMLQAIGEGLTLLEKYPVELDIKSTLSCWQNGTVIRSWLIELMSRAYEKDQKFEKPNGWVEDTGEVNWLVTDAMTFDISVPVIAQSVMALIKSRDNDHITEKAITHMRHEFGGHPYGPDEDIAKKRRTSKVGPFFQYRKSNTVKDNLHDDTKGHTVREVS